MRPDHEKPEINPNRLECILVNLYTPAAVIAYRLFPILAYIEVPELECSKNILQDFLILKKGNIETYAQLIRIKEQCDGRMPENVERLMNDTRCGSLMLRVCNYFRN